MCEVKIYFIFRVDGVAARDERVAAMCRPLSSVDWMVTLVILRRELL